MTHPRIDDMREPPIPLAVGRTTVGRLLTGVQHTALQRLQAAGLPRGEVRSTQSTKLRLCGVDSPSTAAWLSNPEPTWPLELCEAIARTQTTSDGETPRDCCVLTWLVVREETKGETKRRRVPRFQMSESVRSRTGRHHLSLHCCRAAATIVEPTTWHNSVSDWT